MAIQAKIFMQRFDFTMVCSIALISSADMTYTRHTAMLVDKAMILEAMILVLQFDIMSNTKLEIFCLPTRLAVYRIQLVQIETQMNLFFFLTQLTLFHASL